MNASSQQQTIDTNIGLIAQSSVYEAGRKHNNTVVTSFGAAAPRCVQWSIDGEAACEF